MKKILILLLCLSLVLCLTACQNEEDEQAELRGEYFDFAMDYRLDYIPYFALNEAPQTSDEYLMWVFTMNVEEIKSESDASGRSHMTKEYVEEMVEKHFNITVLEHKSLFKCWDYEDGIYLAYIGSYNPLPVVILRELNEEEQDGKTIYSVILDFCAKADNTALGSYGPTYEKFKEDIINGEYNDLNQIGLKVDKTESFKYYLEDDEPVFIEHLELD